MTRRSFTDWRLRRAQERDREPFEWVYTVVFPIILFVGAAAGPILIDMARESERSIFSNVLFWIGVVLLLIAVVITVCLGVHTNRSEKRVRQTLTDFNHHLGDTIRAVQTVIGSDKTLNAQTAFFKTMVAEAKSLIPLNNPRICVYLLEASESDGGEQEFLKNVAVGGRSDNPRNFFASGTPEGDYAISVAKSRVVKRVHDVRHPPSGVAINVDPDVSYQSFMQIPLVVDGQPKGLLTIDTTDKTFFRNEHEAVARTVARFIELGMLDISAATSDTSATVSELQKAITAEG